MSTDDEDAASAIAISGKRIPSVAPPPLWRVLRANVVIFLYTLPINAFSIVLLYGLVTMGLSETIHTQWDDIVALSLSLVFVPLHMCWSLGNARRNWEDRRLARNGRLPLSRKLLQLVQLAILYLLLFLLLLVSMYSASATLQARALLPLKLRCVLPGSLTVCTSPAGSRGEDPVGFQGLLRVAHARYTRHARFSVQLYRHRHRST